MLQRWLGETPLGEFLDQTMGRQPFARPGSAADAAGLLQWATLDRLLRRPGLDVLAVLGGRVHPAPPPRSLAELRRLLAGGVGIVVRRAERHDAELARLAGSFARELPGRVHVQLFVTAAGTSGFGWHYDAEQVFIVQTLGHKDFYFRRNTVDPQPAPGATPDFGRVREETTPIQTCSLLPGDWLHLPRSWWHVARARTDSLSISLGVVPDAPGSS